MPPARSSSATSTELRPGARPQLSPAPAIDAVRIAAPAAAWEDCGFTVAAGEAAIGSVRLRFEEGDGAIAGWSLRGVAAGSSEGAGAELDGLATDFTEAPPAEPGVHANGAERIDHIVIFTPDLARTSTALEAAGLSLRRIREPDEPGPPVRQGFFRLGEVVLEVVENPKTGGGPARFWGLTLCVADVDACADLLGERLGEVHDAVQPGRRIATVRREAGLGIPVALISPGP